MITGTFTMYESLIGHRMAELRASQGLSASALARRIGISQPQISRLENGKQSFRSTTLAKIAHALGVSPVYFFLEKPIEAGDAHGAYGPPGKLGKALRCPEFRDVMEQVAERYLEEPADTLSVIETALRARKKASSI